MAMPMDSGWVPMPPQFSGWRVAAIAAFRNHNSLWRGAGLSQTSGCRYSIRSREGTPLPPRGSAFPRYSLLECRQSMPSRPPKARTARTCHFGSSCRNLARPSGCRFHHPELDGTFGKHSPRHDARTDGCTSDSPTHARADATPTSDPTVVLPSVDASNMDENVEKLAGFTKGDQVHCLYPTYCCMGSADH